VIWCGNSSNLLLYLFLGSLTELLFPTGRVAQEVEHLLSRHKALSSNPSNIKRNSELLPSVYVLCRFINLEAI
jgi:hypothetical protein